MTMTLQEALRTGPDAEVDRALGEWRDRNPDATLAVVALELPRDARRRLRAASWRVFGTPLGGWVTGA